MPPTASKASPVIPLLHSRWRNFLSGLCILGLRLSISLLSYSPPPWPTMPSLHLSFVMLPSNFTKTISGEQFRLSSIIFGSIRRTTSSSLRVCQPPLLTHTMISFTKSAKSLFLFGAPGAFFSLYYRSLVCWSILYGCFSYMVSIISFFPFGWVRLSATDPFLQLAPGIQEDAQRKIQKSTCDWAGT